jgi:hypothetical protein
MGLGSQVDSAVELECNTRCRESESSKKTNFVGTIGVFGMTCILGDAIGDAGSGNVSWGILGGVAGVT